uniref:Uncharacterized protein n=1 Tax=Setaria viridis TaxID=4556 RepID=A0A4U6VVU9_SETVI|nr:hypothetical protein SEVIR_2G147166v2 [Setaria viridis]
MQTITRIHHCGLFDLSSFDIEWMDCFCGPSGCILQVEIQVGKIYCINRAIQTLPINLEDAARSEAELEKAEQAGEKLACVGQDTRLNYRTIDLRTPSNQAVLRIHTSRELTFDAPPFIPV